VVLDQDNGEDSVNGNLSSKDSMILDIIRHGSETGAGMTSEAIRNALKDRGEGIRDQAVSDCISSLYAKKLITFSGMMRSKTNPRIWSIVSTDDVPPLGVKNQNEMPGEADGGRKTTELDMNAGSEYDAYNAAQRELEADFFGSQTEESDE